MFYMIVWVGKFILYYLKYWILQQSLVIKMWNIQVCGLSNKLVLSMKFCSIIDWDGFVNMSMLESPTIKVGQIIGIFFLM
jgi:hypothetical protein